MATEGDGKKLCDLRVVDLRAELEKRGLDKTGVKAHLIERLQKALQNEDKNPDEYEFDLSDKKTPVKRLSTSTNDQNDGNVEQAGNDSSVLMIETPSLETSDIHNEGAHENDTTLKKCDNISSESPLNLSIEEEEEHMLLNSGDEHDTTTESIRKDTDEKSTTNAGASSDSAKVLVSATTKENDEEKEEDEEEVEEEEEEEDGNTDEVQVANRDENVATSTAKSEDTASMTETGGSTAPAPEMSNSTAVASDKDSSKNDKDKNSKNGKSNPGRSLWVTNLLPSTRAQELKHLLSRFGKVIGAKVVQSSRYPRTRCYGYVTMETRAAADLCIEKLNNTELKGQIIRVAKVRPEHSLPLKTQKKPDSTDKSKKKTPPKQTMSSSVDDKSLSDDKRKASSVGTSDKRKDDKAKKDNNSKDSERESRNASRSSSARKDRSLSKSSGQRPERKTDILTFDKIREERERQRQRERERALREEEKRRRELQRAREIEKRQREEAMRLEREREKLRVERERLDRQRVEIMRLERERQRLEREKLEQEKQELRRQQMRLEEARRPVKRPSSSSTSNYRRENASYNDDRKRLVTERHYEETPPPPRFEVSSREPAPEISNKKEISKDYKSRMAYSKRSEEYAKRAEFKRDYPPAERHSSGHPTHMVHSITNSGSSSKYESSAYVNRERDIREPGRREAIVPNVPPPRISKDARYNERGGERSPVPYRTVRDERERRPVSDHHTKSDIRSSREHRYADNAGGAVKDGTRYRDSSSQWHSNSSSPVKPFSGMSGSTNSSRDSWSKADTWRPMESSSNDRWGNSSSRIILSNSSGVPNAMYAGGNSNMSGMGAGMSCPPPPGNSNYSIDRFDNYKSITSSRKY